MEQAAINRHQISIIIPVYNEQECIGQVLDFLLKKINSWDIECEVIVVDDASKDSTAEIVKKYDVKLVSHEVNKGYGAALKTGIQHAKHQIIAITDGDGTYPVERIAELAGYMQKYDMVVGARKGNNVNIPFLRKPAKWFLNKYANYLVKEKIPDLNSGLRVFKKDVFEKFRSILPSGFSLTTTLTLALLSDDYSVKYIPIDYYKRGGKSKIRPIRDTINFVSLLTRISVYFNPLRIFGPVTILLIVGSVVSFVFDVFILNITDRTMMLFLGGLQIGIIGLVADLISRKK